MSEEISPSVEKVARDLFRFRCSPLTLDDAELDKHVDKHWESWVPTALVAIDSVLEMTKQSILERVKVR